MAELKLKTIYCISINYHDKALENKVKQKQQAKKNETPKRKKQNKNKMNLAFLWSVTFRHPAHVCLLKVGLL